MLKNLVPALVLILVTLSTAHESLAQSSSSAPSDVKSEPEVDVPFGCGYAFPVSQTHNTGSHLQNDVWAWDFRMPEGTPVVAARDGVVRMARGDSTEGGCDPRFAPSANYVVLDHGEGTETQYLHFSAVVVHLGDRVKAGDLLGFSGKTGWACGAHLHFKVAHPNSVGWNNPSVQARLAGYGDPALESVVAAPACGARSFIASRPPSTSTPLAAVKAALASSAQQNFSPAADPASASSAAVARPANGAGAGPKATR